MRNMTNKLKTTKDVFVCALTVWMVFWNVFSLLFRMVMEMVQFKFRRREEKEKRIGSQETAKENKIKGFNRIIVHRYMRAIAEKISKMCPLRLLPYMFPSTRSHVASCAPGKLRIYRLSVWNTQSYLRRPIVVDDDDDGDDESDYDEEENLDTHNER